MKRLGKVLACGALLAAGGVVGAGFSIIEQSTVGLGRSLAGMTAEFGDPGALYFNPSVGAWHDTRDLMLGTHVIMADVKFHDRGSTLDGTECGNVGNIALVPNMYYINPVADGVSINLGISATSGTSISYSEGWIGRYQGFNTEVKVVEFAPSISWRLTDEWAVGLGVIIQDAGLEMSQALPLNAMTGGAFPDGRMKLKGDSTAWGVTCGLSYQPAKGTRFGLGYRSAITHEADLDGKTKGINPALAGAFPHHFDADLQLNLPDTVSFGYQQDIGEKWTLALDVCWNNWSCLEDLTIESDAPALNGSDHMNWRDSWRFSLGADYRINDRLTLRFGGTYDMTPVKNEELRTVRLPDVDRFWASCGLGWNLSEDTTLDFAYTHLFFDSADIERKDAVGTVKGTYYGCCELFSFSMTHRF